METMTYEEACRARAELDAAVKEYRADPRFAAMAKSTVGWVMADHGPVDPEKADRDAYDIAMTVAITLLARIYRDDAEIAALRRERDHHRATAARMADLTFTQPAITDPNSVVSVETSEKR